jgi:transcriptional regulator with XRE-family HTH domain
MDKKNFGKNLRVVRKDIGLTQDNFAKTLGVTGSYISDLERGKAYPSEPVIRILEREWRINREFLDTGKGPMYWVNPPGDAFKPYPIVISQSEPELFDLISKAITVLKSKTHYASSLSANIESFHQAVIQVTDINNLKKDVEELKARERAKSDPGCMDQEPKNRTA